MCGVYNYICYIASLHHTIYVHIFYLWYIYICMHYIFTCLFTPFAQKAHSLAQDLPFKDVEAAYLGLWASRSSWGLYGEATNPRRPNSYSHTWWVSVWKEALKTNRQEMWKGIQIPPQKVFRRIGKILTSLVCFCMVIFWGWCVSWEKNIS